MLHAMDTKSALMPEFLLPPNHPGFAVLVEQSSLRDPKRVSAGSQRWDSEAEERVRSHTHHVMPGVPTGAVPQ